MGCGREFGANTLLQCAGHATIPQAAAAEQAARHALDLERIAREDAEKAREALEGRLAELEASEASQTEEEDEAGPALSADAILGFRQKNQSCHQSLSITPSSSN